MTKQWRIVAISVLPIVVFFLLFEIGRPQYYEEIGDAEQLAYYNTKLVASGKLPQGNLHPGTPLFIVSAPILKIIGDGPDRTEIFLRVARFLIAFATMAALVWWTLRAHRFYGPIVAAATYLSIVSWPSLLGHMTIFTPTSTIAPIALVLITLYHRQMLGISDIKTRSLLIAAALCGTLLAIKLSSIILIAVVLIGLSAAPLLASAPSDLRQLRNKIAYRFAILLAGTVLTFGLWTSLIYQSYMDLLITARSESRHFAGPGELLEVFISNGVLPVIMPALLLVIALGLIATHLKLFPWRSKNPGTRPQDSHHRRLGWILIGITALSTVGVLFGVRAAVIGSWWGECHDWALAFRNTAPALLLSPIALIGAHQYLTVNKRSNTSKLSQILVAVLIVAGALSLVTSIDNTLEYRKGRVCVDTERNEFLGDRISTASSGNVLAIEPRYIPAFRSSFHQWGNYRFGYSSFDQELAAEWPYLTTIDLRQIKSNLDQTSRSAQGIRRLLRLIFPLRTWWQETELFAATPNPDAVTQVVYNSGIARELELSSYQINEFLILETGSDWAYDVTSFDTGDWVTHRRQP